MAKATIVLVIAVKASDGVERIIDAPRITVDEWYIAEMMFKFLRALAAESTTITNVTLLDVRGVVRGTWARVQPI